MDTQRELQQARGSQTQSELALQCIPLTHKDYESWIPIHKSDEGNNNNTSFDETDKDNTYISKSEIKKQVTKINKSEKGGRRVFIYRFKKENDYNISDIEQDKKHVLVNKTKINDKTTSTIESDYKENEGDDKSSRLDITHKKENKTHITTHKSKKGNNVKIHINEWNKTLSKGNNVRSENKDIKTEISKESKMKTKDK